MDWLSEEVAGEVVEFGVGEGILKCPQYVSCGRFLVNEG